METVIITGCGYKPVAHTFTHNGQACHSPIAIDGVEHKMNIGTAIAAELTGKGIRVLMVARHEESLRKIKESLVAMGRTEGLISYATADVTTDEGVRHLIDSLPEGPVAWIQSLGMGGGTYAVKDDNPYLRFEDVDDDLLRQELELVVASHKMVKALMPRLRQQIAQGKDARIVVINSMSGERGYWRGSAHTAGKHAVTGYWKGIEEELRHEGVQVKELRPGAIDTGMYDGLAVREAVSDVAVRSGMWEGREPIFTPPSKVAAKAYRALTDTNAPRIQRIRAPHQH